MQLISISRALQFRRLAAMGAALAATVPLAFVATGPRAAATGPQPRRAGPEARPCWNLAACQGVQSA